MSHPLRVVRGSPRKFPTVTVQPSIEVGRLSADQPFLFNFKLLSRRRPHWAIGSPGPQAPAAVRSLSPLRWRQQSQLESVGNTDSSLSPIQSRGPASAGPAALARPPAGRRAGGTVFMLPSRRRSLRLRTGRERRLRDQGGRIDGQSQGQRRPRSLHRKPVVQCDSLPSPSVSIVSESCVPQKKLEKKRCPSQRFYENSKEWGEMNALFEPNKERIEQIGIEDEQESKVLNPVPLLERVPEEPVGVWFR
jgi:hypothetical protein